MIKNILGILIFLAAVIYGVYTTILIAQEGISAVAYLDLSGIINGVFLPIPLIISIFLALIGILVSYSSKSKKL